MDRIKYTTATTGTGNLTIALATGFQAVADAVVPYPAIGAYQVIYTLLDANGAGWETGYGTIDNSTGTTLTRADDWVFGSTNSGARISLSSGTHTVLVNRSFYSGFVITSGYVPGSGGGVSVGADSSAAVTFASVMGNLTTSQPVNGVAGAPGATGGAVGSVVGDVMGELPYARAARFTLACACSDSNPGSFFGADMDFDGYGYPLVGNWAPQTHSMTGGNLLTVQTPWLYNLSPWGYSNYGYVPYSSGPAVKLYNTDASNGITVYPRLLVEWMI